MLAYLNLIFSPDIYGRLKKDKNKNVRYVRTYICTLYEMKIDSVFMFFLLYKC